MGWEHRLVLIFVCIDIYIHSVYTLYANSLVEQRLLLIHSCNKSSYDKYRGDQERASNMQMVSFSVLL